MRMRVNYIITKNGGDKENDIVLAIVWMTYTTRSFEIRYDQYKETAKEAIFRELHNIGINVSLKDIKRCHIERIT